jgi:hypothetical protein
VSRAARQRVARVLVGERDAAARHRERGRVAVGALQHVWRVGERRRGKLVHHVLIVVKTFALFGVVGVVGVVVVAVAVASRGGGALSHHTHRVRRAEGDVDDAGVIADNNHLVRLEHVDVGLFGRRTGGEVALQTGAPLQQRAAPDHSRTTVAAARDATHSAGQRRHGERRRRLLRLAANAELAVRVVAKGVDVARRAEHQRVRLAGRHLNQRDAPQRLHERRHSAASARCADAELAARVVAKRQQRAVVEHDERVTCTARNVDGDARLNCAHLLERRTRTPIAVAELAGAAGAACEERAIVKDDGDMLRTTGDLADARSAKVARQRGTDRDWRTIVGRLALGEHLGSDASTELTLFVAAPREQLAILSDKRRKRFAARHGATGQMQQRPHRLNHRTDTGQLTTCIITPCKQRVLMHSTTCHRNSGRSRRRRNRWRHGCGRFKVHKILFVVVDIVVIVIITIIVIVVVGRFGGVVVK